MGKAKRGRQTHKKPGGLLRELFSPPLRERYCETCGRPHVGQLEPIPSHRINLGNAEVQVFDSTAFGKLRRELRVHCWNRYRDTWYPQSVFTPHDFQHLASVIDHALRFMNERD